MNLDTIDKNDEDIIIPAPESRANAMTLVWKCTNCGYLFQLHHAALPDNCPNCGVKKEFFEKLIED